MEDDDRAVLRVLLHHIRYYGNNTLGEVYNIHSHWWCGLCRACWRKSHDMLDQSLDNDCPSRGFVEGPA